MAYMDSGLKISPSLNDRLAFETYGMDNQRRNHLIQKDNQKRTALNNHLTYNVLTYDVEDINGTD